MSSKVQLSTPTLAPAPPATARARCEPPEEGTDIAFYGAAAWIVAALGACAFLAWYPARSSGPAPVELTAATDLLRGVSGHFRGQWLLIWPAVAMLLGATVAPVVLLRTRGPAVARRYALAAALAFATIPAVWWLTRPA